MRRESILGFHLAFLWLLPGCMIELQLNPIESSFPRRTRMKAIDSTAHGLAPAEHPPLIPQTHTEGPHHEWEIRIDNGQAYIEIHRSALYKRLFLRSAAISQSIYPLFFKLKLITC